MYVTDYSCDLFSVYMHAKSLVMPDSLHLYGLWPTRSLCP